jgi:hypothetical protein
MTAGFVNTIIGYSIFLLLVYFDLGYYLSFSIAHVLGIFVNFSTYSIVFNSKGNNRIYMFIMVYFFLFISGNSFIYLVNIFVVGEDSWALLVIIINSILGYILQKKYVFNKSENQ